MTLAQIIKNLRNNLKLSQRDLAKELNISPSSIAMYETGQRTPDTETLKLLADFFNTPLIICWAERRMLILFSTIRLIHPPMTRFFCRSVCRFSIKRWRNSARKA